MVDKENVEVLNVSGDGLFYTLQGEGVSMGLPAVFLRLQVCNLHCVWCDTPYTWDQNTDEYWEWTEVSVDDLARRIKKLWNNGCSNEHVQPRLVVTGGEPLLQKYQIDLLLKKLSGWAFEIETNGTIIPTRFQQENCQINCSPKLTNSGNLRQDRIVYEVIETIRHIRNFQFKFVVAEEADLEELTRDFVDPFKLPPDRVVIMPEGKTEEELKDHVVLIADAVKDYGYRLMMRMHVTVWGAERRV